MTRKPYRLNATFIRTVKEPGRYGDGRGSRGLSLLVRQTARGDLAKSWSQRIVVDGRPRMMGLGTYPHVSLAEARERCVLNAVALRRGELTLAGRKRNFPTFAEAAERVVSMRAETWKDGGKTADGWRQSLATYAMPRLGSVPVERVTTADVLAVLRPIWNAKRATAKKLRARVASVMSWAIAEGYRTDNPAGEAITEALPRNGVRTQHQRALAYTDVPGALAKVSASGAAPAFGLLLRFQVLTAARPSEARGAQWSEIDLEAGIWRVPGSRMKSGREHRVPLSSGALAVLAEARELSEGGYVFPSPRRRGQPVGPSSLAELLRDLRIGAVPHGFRSSFADWAAERTDAPKEVRERCLAHAERDETVSAYTRTDQYERRREVMEGWAAFVGA